MIRISFTGAVTAALLMSACATTPRKAPNASDLEKYPFITRPEVRTILIPDTVEGNRYIEKHRVFVIEKNSSWSKDSD